MSFLLFVLLALLKTYASLFPFDLPPHFEFTGEATPRVISLMEVFSAALFTFDGILESLIINNPSVICEIHRKIFRSSAPSNRTHNTAFSDSKLHNLQCSFSQSCLVIWSKFFSMACCLLRSQLLCWWRG